jgi:AH receptor-interacting protein
MQITFHYQTRKCDDEGILLDDSKKHDKPMELILGKKFKLEIWEACLKTMARNEVAKFKVEPEVC